MRNDAVVTTGETNSNGPLLSRRRAAWDPVKIGAMTAIFGPSGRKENATPAPNHSARRRSRVCPPAPPRPPTWPRSRRPKWRRPREPSQEWGKDASGSTPTQSPRLWPSAKEKRDAPERPHRMRAAIHHRPRRLPAVSSSALPN